MTTERIEEIQEEIEEIKENRAKAVGKNEEIEKRWKKDYQVDSLEAAETLSYKTEKEVKALKEKEDEIETEIEELLDEMEE